MSRRSTSSGCKGNGLEREKPSTRKKGSSTELFLYTTHAGGWQVSVKIPSSGPFSLLLKRYNSPFNHVPINSLMKRLIRHSDKCHPYFSTKKDGKSAKPSKRTTERILEELYNIHFKIRTEMKKWKEKEKVRSDRPTMYTKQDTDRNLMAVWTTLQRLKEQLASAQLLMNKPPSKKMHSFSVAETFTHSHPLSRSIPDAQLMPCGRGASRIFDDFSFAHRPNSVAAQH